MKAVSARAWAPRLSLGAHAPYSNLLRQIQEGACFDVANLKCEPVPSLALRLYLYNKVFGVFLAFLRLILRVLLVR